MVGGRQAGFHHPAAGHSGRHQTPRRAGSCAAASSLDYPAALTNEPSAAGDFWEDINTGRDKLRRGEDAMIWRMRAQDIPFSAIAEAIFARRAERSRIARARAAKRNRATYRRWRDEAKAALSK